MSAGSERRLTAGGPPLSRLGLGLAALGRPAYINLAHADDLPSARTPEALQAHAHAVLDAAFAAGVRYLDAARSYGRAEAFLRSWLDARALSPGVVAVGSKWGYRYTAGWRVEAEHHEVKEHSLDMLRMQLGESRAALGSHLALYQIHSATAASGVLENELVLDELARLRDAGVAVGVTTTGADAPATVRRALAVARGGAPLFAAVQATWNLLERSCEDALREAHAGDRIVILKETLANGRLGPRGDAAEGAVAEVARGLGGASPDAVAIAAALAQDFADVVLLGAATAAQVASNAAGAGLALGPAELDALAGVREEPAAYWTRRAALPWT